MGPRRAIWQKVLSFMWPRRPIWKKYHHLCDMGGLSGKKYHHKWGLGGLSGKKYHHYVTWEGYLVKIIIIFGPWKTIWQKVSLFMCPGGLSGEKCLHIIDIIKVPLRLVIVILEVVQDNFMSGITCCEIILKLCTDIDLTFPLTQICDDKQVSASFWVSSYIRLTFF